MKKPLLLICVCLQTYLLDLVYGVKGPGVVTLTEAECAKECDVSNPNCYFHDKENCRFYKNCFLQAGKWKGYVRPCPFGQFWSIDWTVCDYHFNVNCQMDKCRHDSSLAHYTNQHKLTFQNCNRNYWACVKGVSEPRCCREGERYEPGFGCVPSGCLGKCLLGLNDICKYEKEGFRFGQGNSNCRKYIECKNKIAISKCCPKHHRYEYGHCIPDTNCDTACGSEIKPLPPIVSPVKPPIECPVYKKQPDCPVGQIWDKGHDGCHACIHDPAIKRLTLACKRDIIYVDLDFTQHKLPEYNIPNKAPSVTKIWAGGKNIKRHQDKLVFGDGNKISYLSFPWYHNNIEARFKIYIELKFMPNNKGGNLQTILSDCYSRGGGPSFAVLQTSKKPENKLTIFAQTTYDSASFRVSYVPHEWNVLRLMYDGFYLRASNVVPGKTFVNKAQLRGKLIVASHPLRFGTCISKNTKPTDQYHGMLDYIKIWGCKTGWNKW